ncbi:MAG: hypothetical protein IPM49_17180 [Flavobacteriales bacterium]|nr:hypothetical protein [Flavobacteriales bacterium]
MKTLRHLLVLLAFAWLVHANAQTTITGNLLVDDTWTTTGSPYTITGATTIASGVTITVEAGVQVLLNSTSLTVNGSLLATSATFSPNGAANAWELRAGSGGIIDLDGCTLSDGNRVNVLTDGTATLTNCTLTGHYLNSDGSTTLTGGSIQDVTYGVFVNSGTCSVSGTAINGATTGLHLGGGACTIDGISISGSNFPIFLGYFATLTNTTYGANSFTGNTRPAVQVGYSTMGADRTYDGLEIPYYLDNGLTVSSGVTWTLGSQAKVKVEDNKTITINGTLAADADPGEEIVFTSYRDDNTGGDSNGNGSANAPAHGSWYGIRFGSGTNPSASTMTRCRVQYAGQVSGSVTYGGVDVNASAPSFTECVFQFDRTGITLRNGSAAFIGACTFGSSLSTPIAMTLDCAPDFLNNTFSFIDNQYDGIGLFATTLTADNTLIKRDVTGTPNVTYVLLGDVIIPAGLTLTVDAGLVIKTYGQFDIHVGGTLLLNGSLLEPITITSVADDNVGNPNDTNKDGNTSLPTTTGNRPGGIAVDIGGTLTMTHVDMRYSMGNVSNLFGNTISGAPFVSPWTVFDRGGAVSLTNCSFNDGTYGYEGGEASAAALTDVTFNNYTQAAVAIQATANPTFSNITLNNVGLDALGIIGGTVTVNGTMAQRSLGTHTNVTQVILGDLTVAAGAQLTIDPGVVVKMGPNARRIIVNGGLHAVGTPTEPIIFTEWRDDLFGDPMDTNQDGNSTVPATGNWYGIRFNATADDGFNRIEHARVRYAGRTGCVASDDHTAAIHFSDAGGVVENVQVEYGRYGFSFVGNSDPAISDCTIDWCTDAVLAIGPGAAPTFSSITVASTNALMGAQVLACSLGSDATLGPLNVDGYGVLPYLSAGFTVGAGATLTILPGTVIKWRTATQVSGCPTCVQRWDIQGALVAVGTSTEPIIFTSLKDDSEGGDTNNDANGSVPQNGDNAGIAFRAGSNGLLNHLQFVSFRYASTVYISDFNGVVIFENCSGTVEDCVIQSSNVPAFDIKGTASPIIQNNFINLIDDVPVFMSAFATPTLSNNTISNVSLFAIGLRAENWTTSGTLAHHQLGPFFPATYFVNGDIAVTSGAHVIIPAGTVFKFHPNSYSSIGGEGSRYEIAVTGGARLDIQGTAMNPVIFTHRYDDAFGLPGDMNQDGNTTSPTVDLSPWRNACYVEFGSSADDASVVDHVLFRYRNKGVLTTSAAPTISNCTFDHLESGIHSLGSQGPHVAGCTFTDLAQTPFRTSILSIPDVLVGCNITGSTKRMIWIENETLLQDASLDPIDLAGITNIPYFFRDGFTVGTNADLTIAPGIMCKFADGKSLTVQRGLFALGSSGPENTIVFTHERDDFYGGDSNSDGGSGVGTSSWAGITFANSAVDADCQMDHCVVRYAQRSNVNDPGAIRCQSASPTITNSLLQHAYYGVRAEGLSDPVINHCDLMGITSHGVYNVSQTFNIDATNCYWGDPSGPTHSGNPGGTGISVTDQVDYQPFASGPISPLMGDVSLNGAVQAYDASLVLQSVVSAITLTPLQTTVADVDANTSVTAGDATLILQYTVGLIPNFPAETSVQGGDQQHAPMLDPAAVLLSSTQVAPGDSFALDLSLMGVDSVLSFQLTLAFDPALIELIDVESLLPAGWMLAQGTPGSGTLILAGASAYPLTQDGAVVRLHLVADSGVTQFTTTELTLLNVLVDDVDVTATAVAGEVIIQPTISTGIDPEALRPGQAMAYPMPAVDGFTLAWSPLSPGAPVELRLYDERGRLVLARMVRPTTQGSVQTVHVDRSELGTQLQGVFVLHLLQGEAAMHCRVVLR